MVTATQSVNDETLQLLGAELSYNVQVVSPEEEDRELLEAFDIEFGEDEGEDADLVARPPVVTVMGHVTTARPSCWTPSGTPTWWQEAGGITQHIGAYEVDTVVDGNEREDHLHRHPRSRGVHRHACRGAETTTRPPGRGGRRRREAADHRGAQPRPVAGVPTGAVNKVDKEGADPQRVRAQRPSTAWWPRSSAASPCSWTCRAHGTGIEGCSRRHPDRRRRARPAGEPEAAGPGRRDRGAPGQGPRPGGHGAGPAGHAQGR